MSEEQVPSGWSTATIETVRIDTEQVKPEHDKEFAYIDISSIDRFRKLITSPQRIYGSDAPSRARKLVKEGDILVALTRPNLNAVAMIPADLDGEIASTGFEVLRPHGIEARWLYYFVRTAEFIEAMSQLVQGALYPAVRGKDVLSTPIPIAPINEQRRITDKLDHVLARVDATNEHLSRVAPLIKRFRQSVLAAATSGQLTADWRADKKSEPWDKAAIHEVAEVGTGSTPLKTNRAFYADKGTPWITSSATQKDIVDSSENYVTQDAIQAHRLKLYPPGTLLIAMYGEGKTRGQVTELAIHATINQACAAIRITSDKTHPKFVKLVLKARYNEMRDMAEGGNQPNLNLQKVKNFAIPLPSLEEQSEIVRRVEKLFAFADRLEKRLSQAQAAVQKLTPALLAKAFRGELVPQDPNDEPASELLKRLQESRTESAKPSRARKPRTRKSS